MHIVLTNSHFYEMQWYIQLPFSKNQDNLLLAYDWTIDYAPYCFSISDISRECAVMTSQCNNYIKELLWCGSRKSCITARSYLATSTHDLAYIGPTRSGSVSETFTILVISSHSPCWDPTQNRLQSINTKQSNPITTFSW